MNPCFKLSIVLMIITLVVVVITLPAVLSTRKKTSRSQPIDSSSSTVRPITTTNHSNNTRSISTTTVTTNATTELMTSYQVDGLDTTITRQMSSHYSSVMTKNSNRFCSKYPCYDNFYYYEAVQFDVSTTAHYKFEFKSEASICFYLYRDSFHPAYRYNHLVTTDGCTGFSDLRKVKIMLYTMINYILIIPVLYSQDPEKISIDATGPNLIKFTALQIPSKV
ncbi:unnamed protein product [Adineta ricciae]|uniref:Uncharacterized protein n=1 Tax=Adineta ricciae TaxID=249248 RepID=A0A815TXX1_ADIRI|nr:unnamed protein product [Adineta ricciae]CAF1514503.1 unnamed protein product [Adineta ricciae]